MLTLVNANGIEVEKRNVSGNVRLGEGLLPGLYLLKLKNEKVNETIKIMKE